MFSKKISARATARVAPTGVPDGETGDLGAGDRKGRPYEASETAKPGSSARATARVAPTGVLRTADAGERKRRTTR